MALSRLGCGELQHPRKSISGVIYSRSGLSNMFRFIGRQNVSPHCDQLHRNMRWITRKLHHFGTTSFETREGRMLNHLAIMLHSICNSTYLYCRSVATLSTIYDIRYVGLDEMRPERHPRSAKLDRSGERQSSRAQFPQRFKSLYCDSFA